MFRFLLDLWGGGGVGVASREFWGRVNSVEDEDEDKASSGIEVK